MRGFRKSRDGHFSLPSTLKLQIPNVYSTGWERVLNEGVWATMEESDDKPTKGSFYRQGGRGGRTMRDMPNVYHAGREMVLDEGVWATMEESDDEPTKSSTDGKGGEGRNARGAHACYSQHRLEGNMLLNGGIAHVKNGLPNAGCFVHNSFQPLSVVQLRVTESNASTRARRLRPAHKIAEI